MASGILSRGRRMAERVEDTPSAHRPRTVFGLSWSNRNHRLRVTAGMVKEVYAMERERRGENSTGRVLGSSRIFNFQPIDRLVDEKDRTIFGAVFKLNRETAGGCSPSTDVPQIVVAFRGTLLESESMTGDIVQDCRILFNTLYKSSRVLSACKAVEKYIKQYGANKVCISGHSLGAAIGLLLGRKFALEYGHYLQAHLFNPPFVSLLEGIQCKILKRLLCVTKDLLTASAAGVGGNKKVSANEEAFSRLGPWVPTLYVNPNDAICSGYREYFVNQESMRLAGAQHFANRAAQNSIRAIVLSLVNGKKETAAVHLIPSAMLVVNVSETKGLKKSHTIDQWLLDNINMTDKTYKLLDIASKWSQKN